MRPEQPVSELTTQDLGIAETLMNAHERMACKAALAVAMVFLEGSQAAADEPQSAEEAAQLQRNIHDMRRIFDGERAQLDGALRGNSGGIVVDSRDAPGIGTLREQLARSLERLESRCFGIDVEVNEGNAVVICGSNYGRTDNSNITNLTPTTVVVVPPSPPPAADNVDESPAQGGAAPAGEGQEGAASAAEVQP